MCLRIIAKTLKGTNKNYYGYKIVKRSSFFKDQYMPINFNYSDSALWKIDTWYRSRYEDVVWYQNKTTGQVSRLNAYDPNLFFKEKPNMIPVISTPKINFRIGSEKYYECGFHFIDQINDAFRYTSHSQRKNGFILVFCEFKERVIMGYQNGFGFGLSKIYCGVARRMRILDEIPWHEAEEAYNLKGVQIK